MADRFKLHERHLNISKSIYNLYSIYWNCVCWMHPHFRPLDPFVVRPSRQNVALLQAQWRSWGMALGPLGDVQGSMEEVAELHTTQTLSWFTMVHTLCGYLAWCKTAVPSRHWSCKLPQISESKQPLWIPQSTLIRYGEIGSGVLKEYWRLPSL